MRAAALDWAGLLCGLFAPLAAPPAHAQAADLFANHCAACHQADGSGTVGLAPPVKGAHWARLEADRAYLPTVLLHGLSGRIQIDGQLYVGSMPSFSALDDAALAQIANHLRGLQGAGAEAAYIADDFKQLRPSAGSPTQTRQHRARLLGG